MKNSSSVEFLSQQSSERMLYLTSAQVGLLNQAVESSYPREGCGFLLGKQEGKRRFVSEIVSVPNQHAGNQQNRFLIEAKEILRVERYARENQFTILGVYHSHTDHPAIPSRLDHESAWPAWSYLILSVEQGQVCEQRSWVLNAQDQFAEERLLLHQPTIG
ncbi:MAG: M67 family metallopeptidase [Bacteroidota bacterium]